jgi:hypothetical protein
VYTVHIYPPGGGIVKKLNRFSNLTMTRSENALGALTLTLPMQMVDDRIFKRDTIFAVENDGKLELDTVWFLRHIRSENLTTSKTVTLTAYDNLYLLGSPENRSGRVIPYEDEWADYTLILDFADDALKGLILRNLGLGVLDDDRDMSDILSIDPEYSNGPIIEKDVAKSLLLPVMQEICDTAASEGTRVFFDIVTTSIPKTLSDLRFTFKTYIGNRGVDRSSLILGSDNGTMQDVVLEEDYSEEITYAYAWGSGLGVLREFEELQSVRRNASRFNRREAFADARDTDNHAILLSEAARLLNNGRPKVYATGKIVDRPGNVFGVHWDYADAITVQERGYVIPARIQSITISVSHEGKRTVEAMVRGERELV